MARPNRPWFRESKGTWYCTLEGQKVSLKVKGRENEKEAVQAWHRLCANGTPETTPQAEAPQAEPKPKPQAVSVGDVLTAYLADCEGRIGRKALHDYRAFLNAFASRFGNVPAPALTTAAAEQYARKPTWSSSTRHDFLGILAAAFTWAERVRLIERSPLVGLRKPPKASRGAKSVVASETVERLLAWADAHGDTEFAALVRFLWLTGCRPSEAGNLTADTVHWEQGCAVLTQHKTAHKGKARVLYLSDEALAVLRQQHAEHPQGYLFRRPTGGKWTTHSITGKFARVCRKAGVKVTSYCLRHTFATDALANGVPDAVVAELLGHANTQTLHRHYAHLVARSQTLRQALDQVR
jgi:integrase